MPALADYVHAYALARREHAYRLKEQGLTYDQVGLRLGVGGERARQLVNSQKRIIAWARNHERLIAAFKANPSEKGPS